MNQTHTHTHARAHEAVLSFEYPDAERARCVARSVRVEVGDIDDDRATATLDRESATVRVVVRADDHAALRAGLNTWSHLLAVAERCAGAA